MRFAIPFLSFYLFLPVFITLIVDVTNCELIQSHRNLVKNEQGLTKEGEVIMEVPRIMAGAYSSIDDITTNPRLMEVAKFAIQTMTVPSKTTEPGAATEGEAENTELVPNKYTFQSQLAGKRVDVDYTIKLLHASQQVVAGMNYRLSIGIFTTTKQPQECIGGLTVTVYDHFGNLSVSTWGKEISSSDIHSYLTHTDNGKLIQSIVTEFNNGS